MAIWNNQNGTNTVLTYFIEENSCCAAGDVESFRVTRLNDQIAYVHVSPSPWGVNAAVWKFAIWRTGWRVKMIWISHSNRLKKMLFFSVIKGSIGTKSQDTNILFQVFRSRLSDTVIIKPAALRGGLKTWLISDMDNIVVNSRCFSCRPAKCGR